MSLRVLILPGDGPSRDNTEYARDTISLLVPDAEFETAEYGRSAWDLTNDILPADTEDAISDSDTVLAGRTDVASLGRKDPLFQIIRRNSLNVRVVSFCGLWSTKPIDMCLISPHLNDLGRFSELDSLDGVEAHRYTSGEDMKHLFSIAASTAVTRGYKSLTHVTEQEIQPQTQALTSEIFARVLEGSGIGISALPLSEAAMALASKPADAGAMVTDCMQSFALYGEASGILGAKGLMGNTFAGVGISLYTESLSSTGPGRSNPTSALMAAACLLIDRGYREEQNMIRTALQETYRQRLYPSDIGGKRTPAEFYTSFVNQLGDLRRMGILTMCPIHCA